MKRKCKWQRIELGDLADPEKQKEILNLISRPIDGPETDSSLKRPSETPQVER